MEMCESISGYANQKSASIIGGRGAASGVGEMPKMREQLFEIEKTLGDASNAIRMGADSLFGSQMLKGAAGVTEDGQAEESISDIIRRVRSLAYTLRDETMRFNRIG